MFDTLARSRDPVLLHPRARFADHLAPSAVPPVGPGVGLTVFFRCDSSLSPPPLTPAPSPSPLPPRRARSKVQKSLAVRSAPGAVAMKRTTTAFSDVQLVISGCNALALSLGRFVFLPSIREKTSAQGPGSQNGESHFAAGDARAEEAASVFATNDPAGFTIVDLLMWGSIGHAVGYSALASQSFVELLK